MRITNRLCVLLLTLLACTGCQTTRSTDTSVMNVTAVSEVVQQPQQQRQEWWTPSIALLFEKKTLLSGDLLLELHRSLQKGCENAQVPYFIDKTKVSSFDVVLVIKDLVEDAERKSFSNPETNVTIRCELEYRTSKGELLESGNVSGIAQTTHKSTGKALSAVVGIATLGVSWDVETAVSRDRNQTLAIRDASAKIIDMAADKAQASQLLLRAAQRLKAHEITAKAAELVLKKKDFRQAAFYLADTCQRFPDYEPALCYLGICQSKLGHTEEARETLSRVIQLAPDTAEAGQAQQWLDSLP